MDRKSSVEISDGVPKVLSFFSGAMGLDIGLEMAGFKTLLACEVDKSSRETILFNKPNIGLIGDIRLHSAQQVLHYAGLNTGDEVELMAGGPPCQAFSTAGKRKGFNDERGNVFLKYISLIEEIKPKYLIIENVRGILSTKLSLRDEDAVSSSLSPLFREQPGSALFYIKKRLELAGYKISFNLYNSANFGTPQIRERIIITGALGNEKLPFLFPSHHKNGEFGLKRWVTFRDAVSNISRDCDYIKFPEKRLKFYKFLKAGQNWRNLSDAQQREALGNVYYLSGGKSGFFRRLAWDKPAPTIVTHPAMPATDLCHPTEDRPLSVQECKRVQEFPDDWIIKGSILDQYRQIGNAVPISLAKAAGELIMSALKGNLVQPLKGFQYSRYKDTSDESWDNCE